MRASAEPPRNTPRRSAGAGAVARSHEAREPPPSRVDRQRSPRRVRCCPPAGSAGEPGGRAVQSWSRRKRSAAARRGTSPRDGSCVRQRHGAGARARARARPAGEERAARRSRGQGHGRVVDEGRGARRTAGDAAGRARHRAHACARAGDTEPSQRLEPCGHGPRRVHRERARAGAAAGALPADERRAAGWCRRQGHGRPARERGRRSGRRTRRRWRHPR